MLKSFGQVRATILRQGMRTSSILNSQHAATGHKMVTKRTQHAVLTMLRNQCRVEMLPSFDQGFTVTSLDVVF